MDRIDSFLLGCGASLVGTVFTQHMSLVFNRPLVVTRATAIALLGLGCAELLCSAWHGRRAKSALHLVRYEWGMLAMPLALALLDRSTRSRYGPLDAIMILLAARAPALMLHRFCFWIK